MTWSQKDNINCTLDELTGNAARGTVRQNLDAEADVRQTEIQCDKN